MSESSAHSTSPTPGVARQAAEIYHETFRARPGDQESQSIAVAWAPGRINLIGEHTDYSGGFVLPAAIDRHIALAGCAVEQPLVTLYSAHHREWTRFRADAATVEVEDGLELPLWARYVQATWRQLALAHANPSMRGFNAAIYGDVPVGAGLSSSAALEVATAMFARALGGPTLPAMAVARLCQQAEQEGAEVRVGIMDQAASCCGKSQHAMLLDCRSLELSYIPANLPNATWLVFDTQTPHTLAASEYNVRRAQCEAAVEQLAPALVAEAPGRRVESLRDVTLVDLARHGALLDQTLARRARHVVTENERTLRAAEALRARDAAALGALMSASHASLRDDYAVSSPELDAAVEITLAAPGALGARMMGAGFGGSILALVRRDALASVVARLAAEYPRRTGKTGAAMICAIAGETGMRQSLDDA